MKYLLALLFSSLLIQNICLSQPITWQRSLRNPHSTNDDEAYSLCAADGQNIYVSGLTSDPRAGSIIKLNQYGDTVWTRWIIQEEFIYSIVSSGDGGCVFGGSGGYAIRLRSDGSVAWMKDLDTMKIYNMVNSNDGKFIFCGETYVGFTELPAICKIDTNGNILWAKNNYLPFPSSLNCIEKLSNGGYISCGIRTDSIQHIICLLKIDENGNVIWNRVYQSLGYTVIRSIKEFNGCFIAMGYIPNGSQYKTKFFKFRLNGDFVDSMSMNSDANYHPALLEAGINKIYFADSFDTLPQGAICLRIGIIDTNLNIKKKISIMPKRDYLIGSGLMFAPNSQYGEINICGVTNVTGESSEDFYVARIDSSLNSAPPPIEVKQISSIIPKQFELFDNFPNPFNPDTKIRFEIPSPAQVNISIYDILGREVRRLVNSKLAAGKYEVVFDSADLPSGVYFYRLTSGDFTQTKKMVLLK
jgi:hypothetical protein